MDQYGAILQCKWCSGAEGNIIVGQWAEDGGQYILDVPPQLRDTIVSLQNALSDQYLEIEATRRKLAELEARAAAVLGMEGNQPTKKP
jgi:1,6-anhydro-N-acetylmuramate kinase